MGHSEDELADLPDMKNVYEKVAHMNMRVLLQCIESAGNRSCTRRAEQGVPREISDLPSNGTIQLAKHRMILLREQQGF